MSTLFVWGPATFVVMLIVGVLLVAGALILSRSRRQVRSAGNPQACPECGHVNTENAQFCARCGHKISRP